MLQPNLAISLSFITKNFKLFDNEQFNLKKLMPSYVFKTLKVANKHRFRIFNAFWSEKTRTAHVSIKMLLLNQANSLSIILKTLQLFDRHQKSQIHTDFGKMV